MAVIVAKGLSDLLNLKIEVNEGSLPSAGKPLRPLDLDCIHKFSLHWVSADGTMNPPPVSNSAAIRAVPQVKTAVASSIANGDDSEVKITIKTLTGKATIVRISESSSVSQLKAMVQSMEGIDTEQQKLMFQNKKLEDERQLSHYNICDSSTVFMIVGLKAAPEAFQMVPTTFLDPRYDYVYKNNDGGNVFSRGNRTFTRPCGWTKKALLVLNKYENNVWVGSGGGKRASEVESIGNEWPVAYHGTKRGAAEALCKQKKGLRTQGRNFVPGKGIYTTPYPALAEEQTEAFEFEGRMWKMIFMDRVNMNYTAEYQVPGRSGLTYLITSDENSVRPYCILFKLV